MRKVRVSWIIINTINLVIHGLFIKLCSLGVDLYVSTHPLSTKARWCVGSLHAINFVFGDIQSSFVVLHFDFLAFPTTALTGDYH